MTERAGEAVLTMWRNVPVCEACWSQRYPRREAVRLKVEMPAVECMVCEKWTDSGIYVRMEVKWHG